MCVEARRAKGSRGKESERKRGYKSERNREEDRDRLGSKSPYAMAGPCNRTKLDNAYLEWPKKSESTGGRHVG